MGVARGSVVSWLLVLTLTSCGHAVDVGTVESAGTGQPTSRPASGPAPAAATSADACPAQEPGHLSETQGGVTDAYVCALEHRVVPGEGESEFHVVRRVTGGLDALLTAYAAPDEGPEPDTACAAARWDPLVVHLHDDRGVSAVRAPVTGCAAPTEPARAAYTSLATTVVAEERGRTTQSQLSVDSTCPDQYKDTLSIEEDDSSSVEGSSSGAATAPVPLSGPGSVCTYRVATDDQGMRVGQLDAHRTLTADQLSAVNEALAQVRADPSCSLSEHTGFAVLDGDRPDATVIALDGCAVSQDEGWWRAGDELRRAVGA